MDDDLDAIVRAQWAALLEADLPSQARHAGETNRPHVTLTVASSVLPYIETALKAALTGRLPVPVRLGGLLCFGPRTGHYVLARAVVPNYRLLELQAICAELFDGLPGSGPFAVPGEWTPHVTLARSVPTEFLGAAIAALGENPEVAGVAVGVRRWDSDARTTWAVA